MRFCAAPTLKSRLVAREGSAAQRSDSLFTVAITDPLEVNGLLIEEFIISHGLKEAQGSWEGVISHQSGFEELR